ncbi:MAG: MarR family transcriptional regulator [Acidimicrobiales bacterium]
MQADRDDLVEAMVQASRALVGIAARSLADVRADVTLVQFRTLVVLATRGPQPPSALAEELAIAPSSVTRMCDRLVAKGLIERRPSAQDGRQRSIALTSAGNELVRHVTDARRAAIEPLVAAIPAEHRTVLTQALLALAAAGGEAPALSWSDGWTP